MEMATETIILSDGNHPAAERQQHSCAASNGVPDFF